MDRGARRRPTSPRRGGGGVMVTAYGFTITSLVVMVTLPSMGSAHFSDGASSIDLLGVTDDSTATTVMSTSDLHLSLSLSDFQANFSDSRTNSDDTFTWANDVTENSDITLISGDVTDPDNREVTTVTNSDGATDPLLVTDDDVSIANERNISTVDVESGATTDDLGIAKVSSLGGVEFKATSAGDEVYLPTEGENEDLWIPTGAEALSTPAGVEVLNRPTEALADSTSIEIEVDVPTEAEVVNMDEVLSTPTEAEIYDAPTEVDIANNLTEDEDVTLLETEVFTTPTETEVAATPTEITNTGTPPEAEDTAALVETEAFDSATEAKVFAKPDEAEDLTTPAESEASLEAGVVDTPMEAGIGMSTSRDTVDVVFPNEEAAPIDVGMEATPALTATEVAPGEKITASPTEKEEDVLVPTEAEDGDVQPTPTQPVVVDEVFIKSFGDESQGFPANEKEEEDIVVVETLVSTATLRHEDILLQHHLSTSHRVLRTVSDNFFPGETKRGFPTHGGLSTFMSVNTRRPSDLRRAEPADIDDVIQNIMNFLGGNARVTAAQNPNTRLTTFAVNPIHTRINDRGPPRSPFPTSVAANGPGSSAILTRTPIRLPIAPPVNRPPLFPGRPQFVANTRPPFLAPLPPSLASRPPISPPIVKPYATGIPIPEDVLTSIEDGEGTQAINPVFPDYVTEPVEEEYEGEAAASESTPQDKDAPETSSPEESTQETSSTVASTSVNPSEEVVASETSVTEETIIQTVTSLTTSTLQVEEGPQLLDPTSPTREGELTSTQSPTETPSSTPPLSSSSPLLPLEPSMQESSSAVASTSVTEQDPILSTTTHILDHDQAQSSSSTSPSSSSSVVMTPPLQPTFPPTQPPAAFNPRPSPSPQPFPQGRPGVVLDDAQYRPGQIITGTVRVPYTAGRPYEVFDVTVSAHQGFGGGIAQPPPRNPYLGQGQVFPVDSQGDALITTPAAIGEDGFVSIDGRKTYFDLFPTATQALTQQQTIGTGVGVVIPEEDLPQGGDGGFFQNPTAPLGRPSGNAGRPAPNRAPPSTTPAPPTRPQPTRKPYTRRPTQAPIRIDTCIVGDDSTCQEQLSEVCRTEEGVSSCYCRPGTDRKRPRTPCKRMVSLKMSLKVDLIGQQRIVWGGRYNDPDSEEYRRLKWEATHAINSAMSKTQMSSAYLSNTVHKFYSLGGKVIVNSTVNLESTPATRSRNIRQALQRQMIQVIQSHGNNIGDSGLWVDGPLNPVPDVSDINECNDPKLHDCHSDATCINDFGSYTCKCLPGYTDRYVDDPMEVGRHCESCSSDFCNKRGECRIQDGEKVCECKGSYYGVRCEIDGEVLGVAVGASVAAVIIIILTLIFLCMWSRRWKAQDAKTEVLARGAAAGTLYGPGYAVNVQNKGMAAGAGGQYGVTLEDRMRWAHIAETLSNQNIYAPQSSEQSGGVYTTSSNEYLTAGAVPATVSTNPFSMYNRVTRALSNSTLGRRSEGILGRLRKLVGSSSSKKDARIPSYMMTAQPGTLNFQQLLALHAQLSAQPEQLRGMAGPSAPPPNATAQRQMAAASSSGYASLGTMGSAAAGQFAPEQFGLHQLNPVNMMATLQQQQQQQHMQQQRQPFHPMNQKQPFGNQSMYGQFGPASLNTLSHGGVSRAPTLGARTPIPLHEGMGGAATIGPMGGASVANTTGAGGMESSEDELDRPYQLPRPKSRGSLGESSDIYYEPEDLLRTIGPPDRPPPPIPTSRHPQTYNFSFLH